MLVTGAKFTKFSTDRKPQERVVWVSKDMQTLCWAKQKSSVMQGGPSNVPVSQIVAVSASRPRADECATRRRFSAFLNRDQSLMVRVQEYVVIPLFHIPDGAGRRA